MCSQSFCMNVLFFFTCGNTEVLITITFYNGQWSQNILCICLGSESHCDDKIKK